MTAQEIYQLECRSGEIVRKYLDSSKASETVPKLSRRLLEHTSNRFLYALFVMASTGCRFSEMRKVRYRDLSSSGELYINGSKGSKDRRLPIFDSENALKILSLHPKALIFNSNVSALNLAILRARIEINLNIQSKINKATHLFRHIKVNDLILKGLDKASISEQIGHMNDDSLDNYINTIPKSFLY